MNQNSASLAELWMIFAQKNKSKISSKPFAFIFCRLMSTFMTNQTKYTLDSLLSKLSCPLLLLWCDVDSWIGPRKAARIKECYPKTSIMKLQAGHCPHDEVLELANKALLDCLSTLE